MNSNEAQRRAEALFKKEQQSREAQKAMADYQAELHAMREKTARLRALRLARDAANQGGSAIHVLAMATSHGRNYMTRKGTLEDCRPPAPSSR
jgi:hypothetical protein